MRCLQCGEVLPTANAACPSCGHQGAGVETIDLRQTRYEPLPSAQPSVAQPSSVPKAAPATSPKKRQSTAAAASSTPMPKLVPDPQPAAVARPPKSSAATSKADVVRPVHRPPTPLLFVFDDGSWTDGEVCRIRRSEFVIGRDEGDLQLCNDPEVSRRHASLLLRTEQNKARWMLCDLDSTNGVFVRITRAPLADGRHVKIGQSRFKVDLSTDNSATSSEPQDLRQTRHIGSAPIESGAAIARLTNVFTPAQSLEFPASGATIGSIEAGGGHHHLDDSTLNGQHARIFKSQGRWFIEDLNSYNGCWLQINQLWVDQEMEFQVGEHRFRFLPKGRV